MIESVLKAYGLNAAKAELFGNGLIHHTWKIVCQNEEYILQKIQTNIFKKPEDIAYNIRSINDYLNQHHPEYFLVTPIQSCNGDDMIFIEGEGYFRLFPFVKKSHSKNIVETPDQAYEAALQFGRFTKTLSHFDTNKLKITIPNFHNLEWRYQHFLLALKNGNAERIHQSKKLIDELIDQSNIVSKYHSVVHDSEFKLRVTHHDTKISNVLFDKYDKAICVIDLDTVMPGYFISDAGDMMRTYLSPANEEEKDFDKIIVRNDFYKAIVKGYNEEMKDELTEKESGYFFYAGQFMIYMQALRFLTDYLNDDIYYGTKYNGQNFVRAGNQMVLLKRLTEKENELIGKT